MDLTVPFLKYLLGAYFSLASEEGCGTFPDAALYLFLAGPMTGADARSRCQDEGGRLMTFKTREEALAIRRVRGWDWKYEQATFVAKIGFFRGVGKGNCLQMDLYEN